MQKLYCFICLLLPFFLSAQEFEEEIKNAFKQDPKIDIRLDSRHSFINQTGVKVFGIKMGVQYDKKISIGIGYNILWEPLDREIEYKGLVYTVELGFYNFSPYIEYVFYRDERWELSIPVQLGFGSSFYTNKEDFGPRKIYPKFVMSYEPAITFQYRFLRYFGAGLGVGYRLMVLPNSQLKESFTSPVYIFKTNIYFQDIIRDIKGE